jgi:hypothetical protein
MMVPSGKRASTGQEVVAAMYCFRSGTAATVSAHLIRQTDEGVPCMSGAPAANGPPDLARDQALTMCRVVTLVTSVRAGAVAIG